jgi:hypothetical protein
MDEFHPYFSFIQEGRASSI